MTVIVLVVLLVIVSLVLLFALRGVLTHHVSDATQHLQGMSQEYLRKQDELQQRLEEADRLYQQQLAKTRSEIDQMQAKAAQELEAQRQQSVAQAREEGERIVKQAMEARGALEREMERRMEQRAVERACELVKLVLPANVRRAAQQEWLQELLQNGVLDPARLEGAESLKQVEVITAFPLSDLERQRLAARLRELLQHDVSLEERVDESLIMGLMLKIGHLVIDGSLGNKLSAATRRAQDEQSE